MRTAPAASPSASELLFGSARGRLLAWLYGHPDERFYLRQLVRQTGAAQGSVQRELQLLTGAGLILRTVEGHQVYFQANAMSPIFPELQRLLLKTFGVSDVLRRALAPLSPFISVAFVYGSAAKNALHAASDIDLLIVGEVSFRDVVAALESAQHVLGREINPSIYPHEEFAKKLNDKHHFLTTIVSEPKIFIIGSEHEFGRLAEDRVGGAAQNERSRNQRLARRRRPRSRR